VAQAAVVVVHTRHQAVAEVRTRGVVLSARSLLERQLFDEFDCFFGVEEFKFIIQANFE
jgi:hypothetical protein